MVEYLAIPWGYIEASLITFVWGVGVGSWLGRRMVKQILREYRAILRRAYRQRRHGNTPRIGLVCHQQNTTSLTVHLMVEETAIARVEVESAADLAIRVLDKNDAEIKPERAAAGSERRH